MGWHQYPYIVLAPKGEIVYLTLISAHQCQTIEQCTMLDVDIHKGEGVSHMRTNVDMRVRKHVYFQDVLYG